MSPKKKEPLTRATDGSAEDLAAAVPQPIPELPASVIVEVPLGPLDQGYLSRHVEARFTSEMQREAMRRLTNGLRQAGEKLVDGKPVTSHADAVKWLLEQVGSQA
jgi:hypothetical protein